MPCHLLALLLGTFLGVSAQTIQQWPATRVQLVGSALSLECTVKGVSSPSLYWYRQATGGGGLQLLFYSINMDQREPEKFQNFNSSRPQDGLFILSSKKLLLSNSGFYLCAWSPTLSPVGQASVQKPLPLPSSHHPVQEPSLKDWLEDVFVIEFLTGSQCEGNCTSQILQKNFVKFPGRTTTKRRMCVEAVNGRYTVKFTMCGSLI